MTALVMEPREAAGKDAANDVVATGFVAVPHGLIASPVSDQAILMWVLLANTPASRSASALAATAASKAAEKTASEAAGRTLGTALELTVDGDTDETVDGPSPLLAQDADVASVGDQTDDEAAALAAAEERYGWRRVSHASLSRRAGWNDVSAATASQRWCRACRELVEAGWVRTCTASVLVPAIEQRITVPLYQVGDTSARASFEQLPRQVLAVLAGADADTGLLVRHWLVWRMSAGARGWTAATVPIVAAHLGVRPERVSSVLNMLAELGVLTVTRRPGRATVVAFRPVGQNQPGQRLEQVMLQRTDTVQRDEAATSPVMPTMDAVDAGEDVTAAVTGMGAGDGTLSSGEQRDEAGRTPPLHLSDHPPLDCRITPPPFVGHVLDSSSHEHSHTVAKPVETLTRRAHDHTAAMRPNHDTSTPPHNPAGRRRRSQVRVDTADRQAMRIVAGLQAVAGQPKLRGQLRQRIATLLRRYPDIDPTTVGTAIAEAFHDATSTLDGIGVRHVELVNQTIANLRADQLAAPTPDSGPVPVSGCGTRARTQQTTGPCLADLLSDQPQPVPGPDEDATDWAVARIARYVHAQEPQLRARALELYPRHLQQTVGHYPEIHFATQIVARALANEQLTQPTR